MKREDIMPNILINIKLYNNQWKQLILRYMDSILQRNEMLTPIKSKICGTGFATGKQITKKQT